ncbi:MAG: hypothetical protein WC307_05660 [Candidatus Nanoarchaeia archaeon]|jgi:hypothetical protein
MINVSIILKWIILVVGGLLFIPAIKFTNNMTSGRLKRLIQLLIISFAIIFSAQAVRIISTFISLEFLSMMRHMYTFINIIGDFMALYTAIGFYKYSKTIYFKKK